MPNHIQLPDLQDAASVRAFYDLIGKTISAANDFDRYLWYRRCKLHYDGPWRAEFERRKDNPSCQP